MITILIVGAIIMFSFWGLMKLGSDEIKKKKKLAEQGTTVYDERLADWSPRNDDDVDDAVFSSDGKRIG